MWTVYLWVNVTGEKMTRWRGEAETVEVQVVWCSASRHAELIEEIRIKMRRIRDAQSCESSCEEDRQVSLVRMDRGV